MTAERELADYLAVLVVCWVADRPCSCCLNLAKEHRVLNIKC
jgi:hypothetical protein